MSGERDVRELAQELNAIEAEIVSGDLMLDEVVAKGKRAVEVYREVRQYFLNSKLGLRKLCLQSDGSWLEEALERRNVENAS